MLHFFRLLKFKPFELTSSTIYQLTTTLSFALAS